MTEERICNVPIIDGMSSIRSGNTDVAVRERIVRCRDCKHCQPYMWIDTMDAAYMCTRWGGKHVSVKPDGFCFLAQPKDDMTDELLPCPFCGGVAHLVSDYSSELNETKYNVWHECSGYEGRSNGYGYSLHPWFETPWYSDAATAVAAWNRRA